MNLVLLVTRKLDSGLFPFVLCHKGNYLNFKQYDLLLATKTPQAISSADVIVVMEKGRVKWVGSSTDLAMSLYSGFSSMNDFDTSLHMPRQDCLLKTSTETKRSLPFHDDGDCLSEREQDIVEVEHRKEGRVELTVYK